MVLGLTASDECTIGRVFLGVGGSGAILSLVESFLSMNLYQPVTLAFSVLLVVGGMLVHEYCPSISPPSPPVQ